MTIEVTVHGAQVPMGSKRAFVHNGRAIVTDQQGAKLKSWQGNIREKLEEVKPDEQIIGPVAVHIVFYVQRPKGHYGTGMNAAKLKESAPDYCSKSPDIDKLARAVLDCATGIIFRDDAQVCRLTLSKRYSNGGPWTTIAITEVSA